MATDRSKPALDTSAEQSFLTASRALLGVVARSMKEALDEVSLPQFRVLVILTESGPLRVGAVAERMGVHPSTFSRTADRLVAAGWISRSTSEESRREVIIELTEAGRELVARVSERRRRELAAILEAMPIADRELAQVGMELFTEAAGEPAAEDVLILGL